MKKTSYDLERTPSLDASRYDVERSPDLSVLPLMESESRAGDLSVVEFAGGDVNGKSPMVHRMRPQNPMFRVAVGVAR